MKKYNPKKIYEIIKFIFVNLVIYGIVIGVICGLIVTFLFYTPKISLINTSVRVEGDKFYFDFIYENKGESIAVNVEFMTRYVTLYKNEIKDKGKQQFKSKKQEVGDIVKYTLTIDHTKLDEQQKEFLKNSKIIILAKTKHEDSYKCRYFINKLLGNQYSVSRLVFYDVSKKEKALSGLSIEKRNEYKNIIDKWLEE